MNIGLIDSGIGGLSVLQAFIDEPINARYFYIADSKHIPYGTKSDQFIEERMIALCQFLLTKNVDIIVIACNTATAVCASNLRARFPNIPIVGIEPAIKPASTLTKTKHIAIAATRSMINSPKLQQLIDRYADDLTVHKIEAGNWVKTVEEGDFDTVKARDAVNALIDPLKIYPVDQFILGCTHFPFLRPTIQVALGDQVNIIDPAFAVAKHTLQRLKERNILECDQSEYYFFTTGDLPLFNKQLKLILLKSNQIIENTATQLMS